MTSTALEKKYLGQSETPEIQVARAEGSYIFDANGKKYIDFVMGWCVGNFGWANPDIVRGAERYRGPDYVYPEYSYKPWGELARLLASIAPGKLTRCFRATGGSEAVELALQAAMVHTGRRKFLSLEGSYHGNTIGTLSIADSDNRKKFRNLLPFCQKIDTPFDSRALGKIETKLKRRDVAAFIMEPISINLGVLIPEKALMTELQRLCKRYGTLLVMDEVACGFGRTGKLFASEHFGLAPDIMCLGKAITGGVAGMGATITTEEVGESLAEDGSTWSTFGWHPRSVAVAIATLRYIIRTKKKLLENVAAMSEYFRARLSQMEFRKSASISIQGLAIGLDFGDEEYADRIAGKCTRNGLLVTSQSEGILLLPALTIDRRVAERGLAILEDCI
ncbi:MAG TPA: aspartate aminotransferase family protein [Gemmatimonadaceae bacterium]|jgi:acetylornithine/succinyldiaminopimelate/putrescine aminotransferase|nr:aspartate aminotransferase family protein [Gemmatimonadaceae bacterium]